MFTKIFKKRNFICPGCGKHLLRELKEPPCQLCEWDGDLTRVDPEKLTTLQRGSWWMMIPMGFINFGLAIYFGFLAFNSEPYWLILFVGGNSVIFTYAVWKFWWKNRGQKKSL